MRQWLYFHRSAARDLQDLGGIVTGLALFGGLVALVLCLMR
jgi:hypothetical protein